MAQFARGYFPDIPTIKYDPAALEGSLVFRQYNANEVILGRPMKDWLRFGACFWHTFRGNGSDPFGVGTLSRPWDNGDESLETAFHRLRAGFEFFEKLGVPYWTFHDRDIAPEGKDFRETCANLDQVVALAKELQAKTGVKLLWGTCNLFSHPRYRSGAGTSPNSHAFAYAIASVKKMLEVTKELGGENFVFWGGREGFSDLLNTDVKRELDHMAAFFRLAVAYAKKIGFKGQFLIEPKPKEPSGHQYDYDAQTVIGFLYTYGLEKHFKVNIEPNHTQLAGHRFIHDVHFASKLGFLGSIDANTGSEDLGWDTDQFPMDVKNATDMMRVVIEQGGLAPGGLNFDCKVRRESTRLEDMFWGHIGAMDTLALGLRNAAKIQQNGRIQRMLKERYATWDSGLGAKIEKGQASIEEIEDFVLNNGEPKLESSREEEFQVTFNNIIYSKL